jgi:hypothetical protein
MSSKESKVEVSRVRLQLQHNYLWCVSTSHVRHHQARQFSLLGDKPTLPKSPLDADTTSAAGSWDRYVCSTSTPISGSVGPKCRFSYTVVYNVNSSSFNQTTTPTRSTFLHQVLTSHSLFFLTIKRRLPILHSISKSNPPNQASGQRHYHHHISNTIYHTL